MKKKNKRRAIVFMALLISAFAFSAAVYAAEDLSWQIKNQAILSNYTILGDGLRLLAWGITKGVCSLAATLENLFDKTFGLIDLTNYPAIENIIEMLMPLLIALTVLCTMALGFIYMTGQEKRPALKNILIGILAVSCSTYIFSTANNLALSFKDGMLNGSEIESQSYILVNDNLIDLVAIDKAGGIDSLDYNAGNGILHNAVITSKEDLEVINYLETLNWSDKDVGQDLYAWSDRFNELIRYKAIRVGDSYLSVEIPDGILGTTIGNEFYYRYSFDFWSCILQLVSLVIIFLALSYKNVRIAYELVVSRILSVMYAADISNGERLKQILLFIRDTYITLCVSVLCVKLYTIFTEAITSFGITGLAKGIVSIFIAFAVIDGPNLIERLLGMDAGLSSSMGRTMALFTMARSAARTTSNLTKKGIGTAKKLSGKGNSTRRQSNQASGEAAMSEVKEGGSSSSKKGNINAAESVMNSSVGTHSAGSRENNFMREEKAPERKEPERMENSAGSIMNNISSGTGQGSASASSSSQEGTKNSPQRVYNQDFKDVIKRLSPSEGASVGERRDFNRQVNNIVRGNHKAIRPPANSKADYKETNYRKALEIERAYKRGVNKDGDK